MKFVFDVLCLINICLFTVLIGILSSRYDFDKVMRTRWPRLVVALIAMTQATILLIHLFDIGNLREVAAEQKINIIGFDLMSCIIGIIAGVIAHPIFELWGNKE